MISLKNKYYDSFCCFRSSDQGSKRLLWELTERCNLNCKHCHVQVEKGCLPELNTEEIFSILHDLKKNSIEEIIFSGGEPMIRNDLLQIISKAYDMGFKIDLCTNGTIYDEEVLGQLANYLSEMSITLDGFDSSAHEFNKGKSGFFDRTVRTIKYLVAKGLAIHIITVVRQANFEYLFKILEFAESLGVHSITFLGLMDTDVYKEVPLTKEQLLDFQKKLEKTRLNSKIQINTKRIFLLGPLGKCVAGDSIFGINSAGYLVPCILYPNISQEDNLKHKSFSDIVQSWNIVKKSDESCEHCQVAAQCGKGCPASSWLKNKSFDSDQKCWKKLYE